MEKRTGNDGYLILDGGMGTMLQSAGLAGGQRPETLSVTEAEKITAIHRAYLDAGAQVVYTNTFGANGLKAEGCGYSRCV